MLFYPYQCAINDAHLWHAAGGSLLSPRVILVGKKSSWPPMFLVLIWTEIRASLQLLSSSAFIEWSGSLSWLRLSSVNRRWASLSVLPNNTVCIAHQSLSLSGGGQRSITVSETDRLLTSLTAKQPASVSASAGMRRGFAVRAFSPLSAVLWFSFSHLW